MPGNPFRRPQPPPLNLTAAETRSRLQEDTPLPGNNQRSTKTKRVRIATPPPISPDPETPIEEEPTIQRVADESHPGSPPPVVNGTSERLFEEAYPDVLKVHSEEVLDNTRRNSGANSADPAMPAARAASGPYNPFSRTLATMERHASSTSGEASGVTKKDKPGMDVDAFTRMLLTGKGAPTSSSTLADTARHPSTTDQPQDAATDSPPGISASDSDSAAEEDRSFHPATQTTRTKSKPPPPAHRHGKSVHERKPQTVSFDDFEYDQKPTDVLPVAPMARSASDHGEAPLSLPTRAAAPTNAAISIGQAESPTSAGRGSKPPPPPTRRGATRPSAASADSTAPDDASVSSTRTSQTESEATVPRRAMAAAYGNSSSRSSSQHSTRLSMPPPPPPRRRGSSKGSVDGPTMTSSNPAVAQKPTEGAVEEANSAARALLPRTTSNSNVLSDLDALQAEVDALRATRRR